MSDKAPINKSLLLFLLIIISIFLFVSSSLHQSSTRGLVKPLITFHLTGVVAQIIHDIFVFVPFVIAFLLMVTVLVFFSNLIKSNHLKTSLKLFTIFILVMVFVSLSAGLTPPFHQTKIINGTVYHVTGQKTNASIGYHSTSQDTHSTYASSIPTNQSGYTVSINATSTDTSVITGNESASYSFSSSTTTTTTTRHVATAAVQSFSKFLIAGGLFIGILMFFLLLRSSIVNEKIHATDIQDQILAKTNKTKQTMQHEYIIQEYLKLSELLESEGITSDFSKTPIEFEKETISNLKFDEMNIITYYYELVRFSESEITDTDIEVFKRELGSIYTKLQLIQNQRAKKDES